MNTGDATIGVDRANWRTHYLEQDKSALRAGFVLVLAAFPIYLYNDVANADARVLATLVGLRLAFVALCLVALLRLRDVGDPRTLDAIVSVGLTCGVVLFSVTALVRPVDPAGYQMNAAGLAAFVYFMLPGSLFVRTAAALALWSMAMAVRTDFDFNQIGIHAWITGALLHFLGVFHNVRETRHRVRAFDAHERERQTYGELSRTSQALSVAHAEAVSARKQLEERVQERTAELQLANAELTRALAAKDQFMATMSHELRTPLTAVIGTSELLAARFYGPLNRRQAEAVEVIDSSSQDLLSIINDLLEWIRQDENGESIPFVEVDLEHAIDGIVDSVRPIASKKRIRISFEPQARGCRLTTEPGRFRQILLNLAGNAVKFTPEGGNVVVTSGYDTLTGRVLVSIEDDGIGIAPADLARIFEPFYQAERGLDRRHEGAGLGLALASRFAEAIGGRIEAESTLGSGSRFRLLLPADRKSPRSTTRPVGEIAREACSQAHEERRP